MLLELQDLISTTFKICPRRLKTNIDNMVFRLHYRLTSFLFLLFFLASCTYEFVGNPIHCQSDSHVDEDVLTAYCWVSTTYTLPKYNNKIIGYEVAHPGVATYVHGKSEVKYHAYYQWVPIVFLIQALVFYLPHMVWKNYENNKIKCVTEGLRGHFLIITDSEIDMRLESAVNYLMRSIGQHNVYAAVYFFCEILNYIIVIVNIIMINAFLGGHYYGLGIEVIKHAFNEGGLQTDPALAIFPRVTKCLFYLFGPSGTIQNVDGLCVLPINGFYEKTYIFLWFWLLLLGALSGLAIMYSSFLVLFSPCWLQMLTYDFSIGSSGHVNAVLQTLHVGDYLVLHLMGQNLNSYIFKEILTRLSFKIHAQWERAQLVKIDISVITSGNDNVKVLNGPINFQNENNLQLN